ncbi:hypothetical protein [Dyella sp.]|nr:hypothetical protein [Dyella sp.]MDR3446588.1 hypothetical protein [Dyella sp.]
MQLLASREFEAAHACAAAAADFGRIAPRAAGVHESEVEISVAIAS